MSEHTHINTWGSFGIYILTLGVIITLLDLPTQHKDRWVYLFFLPILVFKKISASCLGMINSNISIFYFNTYHSYQTHDSIICIT